MYMDQSNRLLYYCSTLIEICRKCSVQKFRKNPTKIQNIGIIGSMENIDNWLQSKNLNLQNGINLL